jgi:hypothetical protein
VEVNMNTLTITNTPGGKLTPNSAVIINGVEIPIPEVLPDGSQTAPRRIGYTLGQHGYMLATRAVADSLSVSGDSTIVSVKPMTMVNSAELAEALWPGCLDKATPEVVEKCSASARRWARRMEASNPGMKPQARVEVINGRQRSVFVWPLELAMKIRATSQGSGNWKQIDDSGGE